MISYGKFLRTFFFFQFGDWDLILLCYELCCFESSDLRPFSNLNQKDSKYPPWLLRWILSTKKECTLLTKINNGQEQNTVYKPSQVTLKENVGEYFSIIQGSQENKVDPCRSPWLLFSSLATKDREEGAGGGPVVVRDLSWWEGVRKQNVTYPATYPWLTCFQRQFPYLEIKAIESGTCWKDLEQAYLLVSQAKTLARHDLNVCAPLKLQPPNSYFEILMPKVMAWR